MPFLPRSRCPRCGSTYQGKCSCTRGTTAGRHHSMYGYRWQLASRSFLQMHRWCVDPYKVHQRKMFAQCVDHIVPHRGDLNLFWDLDNWQSLCNQCHSRKTRDGG